MCVCVCVESCCRDVTSIWSWQPVSTDGYGILHIPSAVLSVLVGGFNFLTCDHEDQAAHSYFDPKPQEISSSFNLFFLLGRREGG